MAAASRFCTRMGTCTGSVSLCGESGHAPCRVRSPRAFPGSPAAEEAFPPGSARHCGSVTTRTSPDPMGGPLGWLTGPGAHPGWGRSSRRASGARPVAHVQRVVQRPGVPQDRPLVPQRGPQPGWEMPMPCMSRLARACGARRDRARPRRRPGRGATASHDDRRNSPARHPVSLALFDLMARGAFPAAPARRL